ncbi:MAG: [NiFe]-hydrogenase assembly chaperone HybE [Thiolinea sp.]
MHPGQTDVSAIHSLSQRLENAFQRILQQRMAGMPFINPRLEVRALGFRDWQQGYLGIMLTPWFMNLMYIPADSQSGLAARKPTGSKYQHALPSGNYEFIAGYEEETGAYQSCSLFSPVFEFDSQQAAELTALAALDALFESENCDPTSHYPAAEIQRRWRGDEILITDNTDEREAGTNDDGETQQEISAKVNLSDTLEKPLSRREFLRGKHFGELKATLTDTADTSFNTTGQDR